MTETNFTVRTRLNEAFFTVACLDGVTHSFSSKFVSDSQVHFRNYPHDTEVDAVLETLGGTLHPCGQVTKLVNTVMQVHKANIGITDTPNARWFNLSGWQTRETEKTCSDCSPRHQNIAHVNSLKHQLAINDFETNLRNGRTLLRWMTRNTQRKLAYKNAEEMLNDFPSLRLSSTGDHRGIVQSRLERPKNFRSLHLTKPFVTAVTSIYGDTKLDAIFALRAKGIKVQWLKALQQSLSGRALSYYQNTDFTYSDLLPLRNIAASRIVPYINAGIFKNVETYIKERATPEQVLEVYRNTNRRKSLNRYIEEGYSIYDAIEASRHYEATLEEVQIS